MAAGTHGMYRGVITGSPSFFPIVLLPLNTMRGVYANRRGMSLPLALTDTNEGNRLSYHGIGEKEEERLLDR